MLLFNFYNPIALAAFSSHSSNECLHSVGPAGQQAWESVRSGGDSNSKQQPQPTDAAGSTYANALGLLADDLNTPAALSTLSAPLKSINDLLTTKAGKKNPNRY